jgi:hypothetical protein
MLKKELETQKARADVQIPLLQKEIAQQQATAQRTKSPADQQALNDLNAQLTEIQTSTVTDDAIAQYLGSIDLKAVNGGQALNILGMLVRDKYYKDNHFSEAAKACFSGFDTLDIPAPNNAYKPRPLEGVWATPPFLHNGSVPNLYEMLLPADKRSKRFFVGRREFDPVKVGFATEPVKGSSSGFWMDTTKVGNLNTGHQFVDLPTDPKAPQPAGRIGPALSDDERWEIIEYLKVHHDLPETQDRKPIDCFALTK